MQLPTETTKEEHKRRTESDCVTHLCPQTQPNNAETEKALCDQHIFIELTELQTCFKFFFFKIIYWNKYCCGSKTNYAKKTNVPTSEASLTS